MKNIGSWATGCDKLCFELFKMMFQIASFLYSNSATIILITAFSSMITFALIPKIKIQLFIQSYSKKKILIDNTDREIK